MAEERLTEREWRQLTAARECGRHGHDWTIIQAHGTGPIALRCERPCGDPGYRLVREGRSEAAGADLAGEQALPGVVGPDDEEKSL